MYHFRTAFLLFPLDSDYPLSSLFSFPTYLWKFTEFAITIFAIILTINNTARFMTHVNLFLKCLQVLIIKVKSDKSSVVSCFFSRGARCDRFRVLLPPTLHPANNIQITWFVKNYNK